MAWGKAGSTTLTTTGDTITVSSLSANTYFQVLGYKQSSGTSDFNWRVGNGSADSGNNYARRQSSNGGTDTTNTGYSRMFSDNGGASTPSFQVAYFVNISNEEKLNITHSVSQGTAGAGTAPTRRESVNKWANTSSLIDVIQGVNVEGGDFASGSNVSILGSDLTPAAAVSFPTNVQVGSRAEITDTRKIHHFADPLTYETDFSSSTGWTQTGTTVAIAGGVCGGTFTRGTTTHGQSFNMTALSDTAWVCRFKLIMNSMGTNTSVVFIGMSDLNANSNSNVSRDGICLYITYDGGLFTKIAHPNGATWGTTTTAMTTTPSTTTWYVEMKRTSATGVSVGLSTTSAFDNDIELKSATIASGIVSLDEFVVMNLGDSGGGGGSFDLDIDDLKIYDGVTSAVGNVWKEEGT